jgi:lysophospholipase L1-like esterase
MPPPERRAVAASYVPDVSPEDYRALLADTVRALRRAGSRPILLVYPSLVVRTETELGDIARTFHQQPDILKANVDAHPRYQDLTRAVGAAEDVTVVDLPPVFDAAGNADLHLDWVHPNRAGHALIASALEGPVTWALAGAAR